MRRDTSPAAGPTREQTEKRLREFTKAHKFNFLHERSTPVIVMKARRCGLTSGKK